MYKINDNDTLRKKPIYFEFKFSSSVGTPFNRSNSWAHTGDYLSVGSLGPDADGFRVDLNVVNAADILSLRAAAL